MGTVWLAQQTALRIPCAVKFLNHTLATSAEIHLRFEREAVAAAQLRSPNVVQILDHGVWEGTPYIAMELLEGEDLEHRLERIGRLPPRDVVAIVAQVARALTRAHAAGLVHRDLKPPNIFLSRDDDGEVVKVLDFGIAKVNHDEHARITQTGAVLGTPCYMSPEQVLGRKDLDHRADLWALAVVTYQCITGRLPFVGEALGEIFMKILSAPLPVPSQVADVPPGFDGWWARALARDPAGRFQTARELSDALGAALGVTAGGQVDRTRDPSVQLAPTLVSGSAPPTASMAPTVPVVPTVPAPTQGTISTMAAVSSSSRPTNPLPERSVGPTPWRRAGLLAVFGVAIASVAVVIWRVSAPPAVVAAAPASAGATSPAIGASVSPGGLSATLTPKPLEPTVDPTGAASVAPQATARATAGAPSASVSASSAQASIPSASAKRPGTAAPPQPPLFSPKSRD